MACFSYESLGFRRVLKQVGFVTKRLLVGIGGGTASGKTTVAKRIAQDLGERAVIIDQDSYYRNLSDISLEERRTFNFDHPDAFDWNLLLEHVQALLSGDAIEKPVYSFKTSTRTTETTHVEPAPLIMVEGILVLDHQPLRRLMDVRLFVDTDDDIRLSRRLIRDVEERGRKLDHILDQYFRSVRPMHHGFVLPTKRFADVIIPNEARSDVAVQMVGAGLKANLDKGNVPQGIREQETDDGFLRVTTKGP